MEEEIIIIVKKPPQNPGFAADNMTVAGPESVGAHRFTSRADAIAFLGGTEALDDRS